ncbi:MAG: M28 family peptidase [Gemmatimonadales bacterium]|nr:MAG: M28 family peptidase [Gemmatimonadales bacterium]
MIQLPRLLPDLRLRTGLPVLLLAALAACSSTPEAPAPTTEALSPLAVAEASITAEAMERLIFDLAADSMRGRDTPSPELVDAARYLAREFESSGLDPAGDDGDWFHWWTYRWQFPVPEESHARARVGDETTDWAYRDEFFVLPGATGPVEGAPVWASSPAAVAGGLPAEARGRPLAVSLPDGLGEEFGMVVQAAMAGGASAVLLLMDEDSGADMIFQTAQALEAGAAGEVPLPIVGLLHQRGLELLAAAGVEDPTPASPGVTSLDEVELSFRFQWEAHEEDVPNVVATLPGSDPELAGESVVLVAHFDHVGVGPADADGDSIYSGADDNASGTAGLVEVGRALASLPEAPARSIHLVAVSGEEKGLLGSAEWASSPTGDPGRIVAAINMDMISRNHPDTVHAVGEEYSSLGPLVKQLAEAHPELGLVAAPDPEPEEQAFLRSDHYSFVEVGIPALMLTTWLHDDYHLPSDRPELADPDKAARVARLAFLLALEVANAPDAPRWNADGEALLQMIQQGPQPPP